MKIINTNILKLESCKNVMTFENEKGFVQMFEFRFMNIGTGYKTGFINYPSKTKLTEKEIFEKHNKTQKQYLNEKEALKDFFKKTKSLTTKNNLSLQATLF